MKKVLEVVLVTVMVIGMIGGLLSCFTFGQKRTENERNREIINHIRENNGTIPVYEITEL